MKNLLIALLAILAFPMIAVLLVGVFITGIGAVTYILVKMWAIAGVVLFVLMIYWIIKGIIS